MRKLIFIQLVAIVTMLLFVNAAQAQQKTFENLEVITTSTIDSTTDKGVYIAPKSFWHNMYVSASIGTNVYVGESDRFGPLSGSLAPTIEIAVGKWITPVVGLRLQYTGYKAKGYTANADGLGVNGTIVNDKYYPESWDFAYTHGNLLINLSNAIGGYKEDRTYSFIPYVGWGFMVSGDFDEMELAGSFGLLNNIRITPSWTLQVDLKGTIVNDRFDDESSYPQNLRFDGLASASIGATYNFKPRGWGRAYDARETIRHDSIIFSEKLMAAQMENEALKDKLAEAEARAQAAEDKALLPVVVPTKDIIMPKSAIQFVINRSELSYIARVNLGFIAEAIKQTPKDKVFTIVGYADQYTGNVPINERLSRERAQVVYDALVNEFGVDPARLKKEHRGGVDNMFYDEPEVSRVVIMTLE